MAIRAETTEAARGAVRRAASWADLVEVRADHIRDLDVSTLLRDKPCPLLFTLRSPGEGGAYEGNEQKRIRTLIEASQSGADWIDVEYSADWRSVMGKVPAKQVLLSYHNFEKTPENLGAVAGAMAAAGAGIVKIATRARRLADNVRIARLLQQSSSRGLRLVALAMGREGIPSRILGPRWGSWMTFSCLPGGAETAEGQVSADLLVHRYRIRSIGAGTRLYGVLGNPLGHSLSPQIHNAALASTDTDAVYLPLEAADLEDFESFDSHSPLAGCSVTIPYKEKSRSLVRSTSETVARVGALNTLVRNDRGWHGENTDVEGFLLPLTDRLSLPGCRVLVLGSGGAARAVAYAAVTRGASVCIAARNREKAAVLAESIGAHQEPWDRVESIGWDLLVNATPVGMYPAVDESPVPSRALTGKCVYDLVYNPLETRLLREARIAGCSTVGGLEMFIGQALEQQRLWFGHTAPETVVRSAAEEALGIGTPQKDGGS